MKKVVIVLIFLLTLTIGTSTYATNDVNVTENVQGQADLNTATGELIEIKGKAEKEVQDYIDSYGSESYGYTAYILNKVRIYSIPFCFIGIAISAIYRYILGIRRLNAYYKGFYAIIAFVTILVICQILPLIFAIVVKGWRG